MRSTYAHVMFVLGTLLPSLGCTEAALEEEDDQSVLSAKSSVPADQPVPPAKSPVPACDLADRHSACPECADGVVTCSFQGRAITARGCGDCQAKSRLYRKLCQEGTSATMSKLEEGISCIAETENAPGGEEPSSLEARVINKFGARCKVTKRRGPLVFVDCGVAADGPGYYVAPDTMKIVSHCGGQCRSPKVECNCRPQYAPPN